MHEYTAIFGYSRLLDDFSSGQAEYVRVPLGDINLFKILDGVPDDLCQHTDLIWVPLDYSTVPLGRSMHVIPHDQAEQVHKEDGEWGMGPTGVMAATVAFKVQSGPSELTTI